MKIILTPKPATPKNISELKKVVRKNGAKVEDIITPPKPGEMGGGVIGGIGTILTGGNGFFSKLGEAIVKHVELKRVDISLKNEKGEEMTLSASLPHDQLQRIVDDFFGRSRGIPITPKKKTRTKKTPAKKSAKTTTKSKTTAKPKTTARTKRTTKPS